VAVCRRPRRYRPVGRCSRRCHAWPVLGVFVLQRDVHNADGRIPPEVLSTEIRGIGTGFATAVSRVGAGIGTFLMPISLHSLGAGLTMPSAAAAAFAGAGLTQWLAPETNGKSITAVAGGITHERVIHCQEGSAPRCRRSGRRDNAQRPARQRRSSEPPARRADRGRRSHRCHRNRLPRITLEVKSTGEHRTPLQQRLFRVIEVVVGPRHRVAQGLVTFLAAP